MVIGFEKVAENEWSDEDFDELRLARTETFLVLDL